MEKIGCREAYLVTQCLNRGLKNVSKVRWRKDYRAASGQKWIIKNVQTQDGENEAVISVPETGVVDVSEQRKEISISVLTQVEKSKC